MQRKSWDEYFIEIAQLIATRSTCLRRKVGAVAVKDKQILATGYNGVPTGIQHCEETGCVRKMKNIPSGERHEICMGSHGEMNVIAQAARHGISLKGCTLYCTTYPCSMCAKLIVNTGIKQVIHVDDYNDDLSKKILENIQVSQFRSSEESEDF